MRESLGWTCFGGLIGSVLVGIIWPTFGSDVGWVVEVSALLIYIGLFVGVVWGFGLNDEVSGK